MTIRHVVSWRFAEQDVVVRDQQVAEFAASLEALIPIIDDIISLQMGINSEYLDANWHVTIIADFADIPALERYAAHPEHQKVVQKFRPLFASRAAVDFTLS
ncbi:Dabb family protein [Klugiella xanthotipulae]|uniref:Stress responsive alpha/beta barrel protein n=1 Tax=Klugiella xanthotipulae TaxID=244735 RepID=A0A543I688_9MICO|nr:Dabb family protein [Klugiella xanthotipulae]TQM66113.1 stress responsive alpha/beta barrel protein [Klugiella xanthotipulae]